MPIQIKIIAGVLIVALAFAAGWTANGWRINSNLVDSENAALKNAASETLSLKETVRQLDAKGVKESQDAQRKTDDIQRRIVTGDLRLSVPSTCPAIGSPGDSRAPAGEARAELNAAIAGDLVAIAAEGDQAIMDLADLQNICVEIEKSCSKH